MASTDTYEAIASLYSPDVAWSETVTAGSRDGLNVATEALTTTDRSEATAIRVVDFDTGETTSHTFGELSAAANRVANYLADTTDRGDRVAAALPVSLELHAVLYGTIQSGRIFVPVSPSLDADGAHYRLEDASASVLVTTPAVLAGLDPGAVPSLERVVLLGGDEDDVAGTDVPAVAYDAVRTREDTFSAVECHPNDPYAISYTSGTTGRPKGCLQTHGKFVRKTYPHVAWVTGLEAGDTYLTGDSPTARQDRPIATHVWGATVAYYRGEFDPEALFGTLADFDVATLHIPPSGLRQLRATDPDVAALDFELTSLVTGGESLDRGSIEWARETLGAPPQEGYGLTEIGMVICNYAFEDWEIKPGSLGRPLPGLTVDVWGDDDESVPAGEIGELVIDLPPAFTGWYWGKPAQSVAEFQGRWYRTGDLVRQDEDGYVWYVTRKSAAIHSEEGIVAPAEVESAILAHDAVAEVGVTGVGSADGDGERLKAVVSLAASADDATTADVDVMALAKSDLAPHEQPDEVEFVDALPKTSTGKIRRTEL